MIRYVWLGSRRAHRSKALHLLTVAGVALGVASVLSIQVLNQNALAAFWGSVRAVSPEADLSVVGRTPVFDESLYAVVLATPGVVRAWPLLQTSVNLPSHPDVFLDVTGLDLLQPPDVPLTDRESTWDFRTALLRPDWIAVTPTLAADLARGVGDTLVVTSGSRRIPLVIGALIDFQRVTPLASSKLAVMDIAAAQEAFESAGHLTQIDVRVDPGADRHAVADRLRQRLGSSVDILTPEQRQKRAAGLVGAFRLNLTALSFISVFVGLFLVFGSTQASLVRRRAEFGLLRSLGATRGQVLFVMLARVLVLATLGVTIGIPLGYWVANSNVDVVSQTLTNLYLLSEIEQLRVSPTIVVLSAAIGIAGAVSGALLPAIDMARRDPHALLSPYTLHEQTRDAARPLAAVGAGILTMCGLWYATLGHGWRPAGFVLAFGLMLGLPLLTPLAVRAIAAPVAAQDFALRFSIRGLTVRLQATAVAVASLAVAVSMLTGITVMIGSFRQTVAVWIDDTVRADIYVTSQSWARSLGIAPLDSALVDRLSNTPGVVAIDRLRGFLGYTGDRRIFIAGVDARAKDAEARFRFVDGDASAALQAVRQEQAIIIGEPLARKEGRWVGDSLTIASVSGPVTFGIAGVRYDYGNEAGSVIMDLETLEARFGPGAINSIALYLDPAADIDALIGRLRAAYRDAPLIIRSNRDLRTEVLEIFDQTFAITRILQAMCLLIAASGITLTLLVIARERVSELALYRALGAARHQIFSIFVGKGFFMGALGLVMGAGGGLVLAMILIYVVNRAYFGWTVQVYWPTVSLLGQALTIMAAATLASVYPALRASRVPATELSRDDI